MSESVRRRKYRYDRVLIETARVLDPQFDDAVVYLTGAQIEMLRNVSQYLNRLDTYVTEYNPGYYIAPTAEDYDSILEIVADMEESLMGNPNTIWGYDDVYGDLKIDTTMPAGDSTIYGTAVPAGEIWRVHRIAFETDSATCTHVRMRARVKGLYIDLFEVLAPVADRLYPCAVDVILREGDHIDAQFFGMTLNDDAQESAIGYKMVVS